MQTVYINLRKFTPDNCIHDSSSIQIYRIESPSVSKSHIVGVIIENIDDLKRVRFDSHAPRWYFELDKLAAAYTITDAACGVTVQKKVETIAWMKRFEFSTHD